MAIKIEQSFATVTEHDLKSLLESWNKVTVKHNVKQYNETLKWCLEHCESKFRDLAGADDCRVWYFKSAKDADLFSLRWS